MKKLFLPLLLLGALLLGGCENRNEAQFRSFSEALRAREDLALTAVVRAEYDDRTCTFTLRCTDEEDGGFCVEVLEPELIRGVRAHMDGGGAKLLYDGISIDTGEDAASQLSPMAALPLLVRALREGMLDSAWSEDGCCAALLVPADGVTVTVLFDEEMKPSRVEMAQDGRTAIFAEITEFE